MKLSSLNEMAQITAVANGPTAFAVPARTVGALFSNLSALNTVTLDYSPDWVHASEDLTLTDVPTDGETFEAGGETYTWKDAVGATARQVFIGATKEDCVLSAEHAVNGDVSFGDVGTNTLPNASVYATSAAAVLTATSIFGGDAGNSITCTETMANGSWGGATLSGGTNGTDGGKGILLPTVQTIAIEWDSADVPNLELRFWNSHAATNAAINVSWIYVEHLE